MREIKFRQRLRAGGYHYWGYIEGEGFVSPCGPNIGIDSEQFTGLLDKEGKEIYEGDIVFCFECDKRGNKQERIKGEVTQKDDGLWLVDGYPLKHNVHNNYSGEVIGNIWENKELLE